MSIDIHLIGYDYTNNEHKAVAIDPTTKAILVKDISPPPTDHGELTGLGDDDHPHYYNQARGDARYLKLVDHTLAVHDTLGLLKKSGGVMTGLLTLSGAPTADLHASTKKYVDDHAAAALSQLTIDVNKDWNAKNITNMGTIEHGGATLKSGVQTEGRCSCCSRSAIDDFPAGDSDNSQASFREKLTNTPSSVTLSNVAETEEGNLQSAWVYKISLFGFVFQINASGGKDLMFSLLKKYVTVGN